MGIYFGVTNLRQYVYNKHFTVRTDSKTISTIFNFKNPSAKLLKIRLELEEYDFTIDKISGHDHIVPDILSRIHVDILRTINAFGMQLRSGMRQDLGKKRRPIEKMTDLQIFKSLKVKESLKLPEVSFDYNKTYIFVRFNKNKLSSFRKEDRDEIPLM